MAEDERGLSRITVQTEHGDIVMMFHGFTADEAIALGDAMAKSVEARGIKLGACVSAPKEG